MKNLQDFQIKKENILKIYQKIRLSEYLTIDNELKNKIEELSTNLNEEKFSISVCGQIKVGKSTFLNDLLFEDYVLPSDDIPETAKLTHISYDENNSYTAYFYSLEEWEDLKKLEIVSNENEKINYFNKYIKESMKIIESEYKSRGEIFYPKTILAQISKSGSNFSELKDYISARGKYTPFVKYLEVKCNSEKIKGVTIVDTPGTNDPNPIRSKVTEDWIGKSDAVIFLMYAGKVLTSQDVDFINNFLLPIPSEKILIGVSKIDVVDDYKRPKEYVIKALKEMGLTSFEKNISGENIYSIAPMTSFYPKIWKKYKENKIILSDKDLEDIENYFDRRDNNDKIQEIENMKGFIPEFEQAISDKLMKNKGEALLDSHIQKICSFFEEEINKKNQDIERLKSNLADISMSDKELEEKKKNLLIAKSNLNQLISEVNNERERINNSIKDDLKKILSYATEKAKKEGDDIIDKYSINYLESNLIWDIKSILEGILRDESNIKIKESFEKTKESFFELQNHLKSQISNFNIFSTGFINSFFTSFKFSSLISNIESALKTNLSNEIIKKLKVSKFIFWVNEEETKNKLKGTISEILLSESGIKNAISSALDYKLEEINALFGEIKPQLTNEMDAKIVLIKELEHNKTKIQDMKNNYIFNIEKYNNTISKIKCELENIKKELEV